MRINRDTLNKLARETVAQRIRGDRGLLAAYLTGSLLEAEFLLGGTADIDLVFVHSDVVTTPREIVRLNDEVHLDIAHHLNKDYRQTRRLRVHPWLGPTLATCTVLYDPQHFMDFTQASVRGQFDRPDHILARAHGQAEHARQLWLSMTTMQALAEPTAISTYLRALEHVANAVALLSGPPLTERRFLLNFPARAQAVGKPGLFPGLIGLLGAAHVDAEIMTTWMRSWISTYQAVPLDAGLARLHPSRLIYYQRAFETMIAAGQPQAVVWPMLRTWTFAVQVLESTSPQAQDWRDVFSQLGLLAERHRERVEALDAYLDLVEETLEVWARQNGAE
jgi:hypothetical protein